MKLSVSWVNEWLCRTISDDEIVDALETAGLEIEQVIAPKPLDKNIVVGLVKKVVRHPEADKLNICVVHDGRDDFDVVCGASNVREGLVVALARVGSVMPDGMVIKPAKLRGAVSNGMLCSEQELGLGSDGRGIIEFDRDLELGTRLCDIYKNDTIVDIKTHANRFDLLSVVGLAREVAAVKNVGLKELRPAIKPAVTDNSATDNEIIGTVEADRFMLARVLLKNDLGKTPDYMVSRLSSSGVRAISPIVDVTNYVNLELGQPLHAYDAAKVKLPISVRRAKNGESLMTLDGIERKLTPDDLVVVDQSGPIGLAGVMGGAGTEVDDNTTEILLEAATFDAAIVRKMAKRHGLRTEASARFERGLPVQLAPVALNTAVQLISKKFGGELTEASDKLNVWPWVQRIGLRRSLVKKILGFEMTAAEIVKTLARLQIEAKPFDVAAEARAHLGKPYVFGANFKANGTDAFDCSYLTDYAYSLIGVPIGHTAHAQFKAGRAVSDEELLPGDLLFRGGFWEKLDEKEREGVSHVAIYVGDGKIVHAADYERDENGQWKKRAKCEVVEEPLVVMTEDPQYLGARRYAEDLDDFVSVASVPWWRTDLKEPEDLIEELVRMVGYDRVVPTLPLWRPKTQIFDKNQAKKRRVQAVLSGAGLFEVMTYSFVSEDQLTGTGLKPKDHLKLKNPMSSEQAYMRSSMLASHLNVAERNRGYARELGFYEISKVFNKRKHGEQPDEPLRLAVMVTRNTDAYRVAKGFLDLLSREMAVKPRFVLATDRQAYESGELAEVFLGTESIGTIGRLSGEVVRAHKLNGEAAYFEIDLGKLILMAGDKQFAPASRFPSTYRDVALVLDESVTWDEINHLFESIADTRVEFLSDFYGGDLPVGKKSLAVRLHISFADRTPTEADAERIEQRAIALAHKKYGAERRA